MGVPGVIEQAEARAHRIGQENKLVDVQFLIVEGTLDERCWECLEQKQASIGAVLDGKRSLCAPRKRLLALSARGNAEQKGQFDEARCGGEEHLAQSLAGCGNPNFAPAVSSQNSACSPTRVCEQLSPRVPGQSCERLMRDGVRS